MTYANLDEAFGSSFNRCEEPPKKKEKYNCNKDKTTFTVNKKDRETDTRNINLPNNPSPQMGNLNNDMDFNNFATFSNKPKNNNLLEGFENPPSQQNQNKQPNPNEIFEYSEEENNFIENVVSEPEPEPEPEMKPRAKRRKLNKAEQINNSQIVEINNKMNFIIDQLNNNNSNNSSDTNESNIHDIVLFILFGVFVIIILESLYKLVVKLCRYKMFNQ